MPGAGGCLSAEDPLKSGKLMVREVLDDLLCQIQQLFAESSTVIVALRTITSHFPFVVVTDALEAAINQPK